MLRHSSVAFIANNFTDCIRDMTELTVQNIKSHIGQYEAFLIRHPATNILKTIDLLVYPKIAFVKLFGREFLWLEYDVRRVVK